MNRTKTGVLGVGHLGKIHAKLLQDLPDAILLGVFDTNLKTAQEVAKELGVIAFESMDALIAEVDAVSVVTPTTTHFEIAAKVLEAGKHVFIEKPISESEDQAQQLIEMAKEKNCLIQVGHIERFNAAILALEDVPLDPIFIEAHRLASFNPRGTDVAVIHDLMIHDIDLILHLVKSKPVSIAASGVGVISSNIDIANARIEFENGCVANLTASRISAKKMRKMRLFQHDAYISMDFTDGISEIFYLADKEQTPFHDGTLALSLGQLGNRDIKYNRLKREQVNPLRKELRSFVASIRNDIPVAVSAEDGLKALRLANQIIEKIDLHQQKIKQRP